MQSYSIDTTMPNFTAEKAKLDAQVSTYARLRRKHMTGVVIYYASNGSISKTEYVYSFSTDDPTEAE